MTFPGETHDTHIAMVGRSPHDRWRPGRLRPQGPGSRAAHPDDGAHAIPRDTRRPRHQDALLAGDIPLHHRPRPLSHFDPSGMLPTAKPPPVP